MISDFPTARWGSVQATFTARRRWKGLQPLRAVLLFAFFGERAVLCDIAGRGWSVPSGHIREGETPEQAIRREAWEEAGITLSRMVSLGIYRLQEEEGSVWYAPVFVGEVAHFAPIEEGSESRGVLLVAPEDVQEVYHLWDPLIARVFQYAQVQYREWFRPGVSLREIYEQFARVEPVPENNNYLDR